MSIPQLRSTMSSMCEKNELDILLFNITEKQTYIYIYIYILILGDCFKAVPSK